MASSAYLLTLFMLTGSAHAAGPGDVVNAAASNSTVQAVAQDVASNAGNNSGQPTVNQNSSFNQEQAIAEAARVQATGSDRNVDRVVDHTMTAIDKLYSLNIPGAVYYGMDAWNSYLSAKEMDRLESKDKANQGTLASVGAGMGGASTIDARTSSVTGNRYMKPRDASFFAVGDRKAMADAYEAKYGYTRQQFLDTLYNADRMITDGVPLPEVWKAHKEIVMSKVPFAPLKNWMGKIMDDVIVPGVAALNGKPLSMQGLVAMTGIPPNQCAILDSAGLKNGTTGCGAVDEANAGLLKEEIPALPAAPTTPENTTTPSVLAAAPAAPSAEERSPAAAVPTVVADNKPVWKFGQSTDSRASDDQMFKEFYAGGENPEMRNISLFERISRRLRNANL